MQTADAADASRHAPPIPCYRFDYVGAFTNVNDVTQHRCDCRFVFLQRCHCVPLARCTMATQIVLITGADDRLRTYFVEANEQYHAAAVKIQAATRGWLTRCRIWAIRTQFEGMLEDESATFYDMWTMVQQRMSPEYERQQVRTWICGRTRPCKYTPMHVCQTHTLTPMQTWVHADTQLTHSHPYRDTAMHCAGILSAEAWHLPPD